MSFLIADLLNGVSVSSLGHPGFDKRVGKGAAEKARAEFRTYLKFLVDQWIDSGTGGEDRNLLRTLPGSDGRMFDMLYDWLSRNMPRVVLQQDGVVALFDNPPNPFTKEPTASARELATFYFAKLLDSPSRHYLARCDRPDCGKYFVYKRAPRGKNGTFCETCRVGSGSVRRTRKSRDEWRRKVRIMAAECWPRWPGHGNRSKWVALEVDQQLGWKYKGVTQKFITQNTKAILAELEGRKRANS